MQYQKILYHSVVGYLTIVSDDHYIRKIEFGKGEPENGMKQHEDHPLLLQAETQLIDYFNGKRRDFTLPLATQVRRFSKPFGMLCNRFHMVKPLRTDNWRK